MHNCTFRKPRVARVHCDVRGRVHVHALSEEHVGAILMPPPANAAGVHHKELHQAAAASAAEQLEQQALIEIPVAFDHLQILHLSDSVLVANEIVLKEGSVRRGLLLRAHQRVVVHGLAGARR